MNRRMFLPTAAIFAGSGFVLTYAANAPTLSASDTEKLQQYSATTRAGVLAAVQGLSAAQWNFKPAPDRWSIAQVVEHMVRAQDLVLGPVREQLVNAPVPPPDRDYRQIDQILWTRIPDRSQKAQAPDVLQPKGQWTPSEAVDRLRRNFDKLDEYLASTPDLRAHIIEGIPVQVASGGKFTTMDGYEWILAATGHVERHTKQILEVKADANFPAQ